MILWKPEMASMNLSSLKGILIPQEKQFFTLLEKQAEIVLKGSSAFLELLKDYSNVAAKAAKIKEIESEGDDIEHEIFTKLNTTFITPIDHSDISTLATSLDDILDGINGTSNRLNLYGVTSPPESLKELADVLHRQIKELNKAVAGLKNAKNHAGILEICIEINTLENRADDIYHAAIAKLFRGNDAIQIIKLKEIYDSIERATDMCESAANIIKDIVMKQS